MRAAAELDAILIGLCPIADTLWQAATASLLLGAVLGIIFRSKVSNVAMSVCLFAFGIFGLVSSACGMLRGGGWQVDPGLLKTLFPAHAQSDPLACLFIALLCFVSCANALYMPWYLAKTENHTNRGLFWISLFSFVYAMQQLLFCTHAVYFLIFWEFMSLSSAALVVTDFASHNAKKAAIIYFGATRISASFLLGAFLWLHHHFGSWEFADWDLSRQSCFAPAVLLFIGLAVKAGVFPFHQWLPRAHSEAPAPVSAFMSGVMVKVAIYAVIRFFISTPETNIFLGYIALGLGILSAVWGIVFAMVERDLKRVLAYSTIENVGLIMVAAGAAIIAKATGLMNVLAIALAATFFHIANHAMYKPLLFQTVGSVQAVVKTRDLNHLGGLSHSMPITTGMFIFGACCICALPPLNGFASKWTIYQTLFQLGTVTDTNILLRSMAFPAMALLSMVGAISVATFAKTAGLGFLGRTRSKVITRATDPSTFALSGQAMLSLTCLCMGMFPAWFMHIISPLLTIGQPAFETGPSNAVGNSLLNSSTATGMSSANEIAANIPLPPTAMLFLGLSILLSLMYVFMSSRKTISKTQPWSCGYGFLPYKATITSDSFVRGFANLFSPVLYYKIESVIKGRDRRHFPELISVEVECKPPLETSVYSPLITGFHQLSKTLAHLQTANIHVHLCYVFGSVVLLLLISRCL